MNKPALERTAKALVDPKKGILAADWSIGTSKKHFEKCGLEHTYDTRRRYREMVFTSPGLEKYISGVIMYEETLKQRTQKGDLFSRYLSDKGILPGIKVDEGTMPLANFPGEVVTRGLDSLRERLADYDDFGAKFTKWRAVITIGAGTPTQQAIDANCMRLAEYAVMSQEAGMVAVIEPEVLMDGEHSRQASKDATRQTLTTLFSYLEKYSVHLPGVVLKTNFVHPGKEAKDKSIVKVAEDTVEVLERVSPPDLAGVVFLSGGDSSKEATLHLNEVVKAAGKDFAWPLTFSFARAIQYPAIEVWSKDMDNTKAQKALIHRARMNSLARQGKYSKKLES